MTRKNRKLIKRIFSNRPGIVGHVASTAAYGAGVYFLAKGYRPSPEFRKISEYTELGIKEGVEVIMGTRGQRAAVELEEVLKKRQSELELIVDERINCGKLLEVEEAVKYAGPNKEIDYVIDGIVEVKSAYMDLSAELINRYEDHETMVRKGKRILTHATGIWQNYKDLIRDVPFLVKVEKAFNSLGPKGYAEKVAEHEINLSKAFNEILIYYKDRAVGDDTIKQLCDDITKREGTEENLITRVKRLQIRDQKDLLAHEKKLAEHLRSNLSQLGITYSTEDSIFDVQRKLMFYNPELGIKEKVERQLEIERSLVSGLEKEVEVYSEVVHNTRKEVGKNVKLEDYDPVPISTNLFVDPIVIGVLGGIALKGISLLVKPVDRVIGTVLGNTIRAPIYLAGKAGIESAKYVGGIFRKNEKSKKKEVEE